MTRSYSIPLTYSIHGRKPGRKTSYAYTFAEMRDIEVEEIKREDAPVAVSWESDPSRMFHGPLWYQRFLERGSPAAHTVWHEGQHWTPLTHAVDLRHQADRKRVLKIDDLDALLPTGRLNQAFGMDRIAGDGKPYIVVEDDPSSMFEEIRYPRLNTMSISKRCFDRLRLISVDGAIYMACDQPSLLLSLSGAYPSRNASGFYDVSVTSMREKQRLRLDLCREQRFLPLSMLERIGEMDICHESQIPHIAYEVHIEESVAHDFDQELIADFFVADHILPLGADRDRDPVLREYFQMETPDEKLAYLMLTKDRWMAHASKKGLDTASLDIAITHLEDREIVPGQSIGLRP